MKNFLLNTSKPLWACTPKNYTGAAATAKYVSLKNYGQMTIVIQVGAWAAGTAAVTLLQATDVSATGAKALAFTEMYSDETTGGTLVKNTVTGDTFNLDTANKIYVIQVDAAQLDASNGFDCLTVAIASPGANADYYGVTYILGDSRYAQDTPPTALTD